MSFTMMRTRDPSTEATEIVQEEKKLLQSTHIHSKLLSVFKEHSYIQVAVIVQNAGKVHKNSIRL